MKISTLLIFVLFISGCNREKQNGPGNSEQVTAESGPVISYDQLLADISNDRKNLAGHDLSSQKTQREITGFWVNSIGNDFYEHWKHTPWDYNGVAQHPGKLPIACGFFVTTVLRDMGLKINRHKLAVCASSEMMKSLTYPQKIRNLSFLTYEDFNKSISKWGKGVYIIGLDFHTGFIVNDGKENWFIHSYYKNRVGVVKEKVTQSPALRSSATRWMVSLTGDKGLIKKWINNTKL